MRDTVPSRQTLRLAIAAILCMPLQAFAAPSTDAPTPAGPATIDVTLLAGGVLQGYVVDNQGIAMGGVEIRLIASDAQRVATTSDAQGRFGYQGLKGGAYQLETDHGVVPCRAWTARSAPPRSAATLLVVHDKQLARGQRPAPPLVSDVVGRMKHVMTNPFAVATIIGAAVAIPVVVHNADQDNAPTSP